MLHFRIFNNIAKKYCNENFFVGQNGQIVEIIGNHAFIFGNSQYFTVEHFTGFYDKNAKRIYQGDVLVYMSDFVAMKYQVIWKGNGFKLDNGEGVAIGFSQEDLKNYEVVGTIHD